MKRILKRLALIAPLLLAALLGFGYGSLPAGPNINMASTAPRLIFSDPTGSAATFTASTARTCPTGVSLADVGVDVQCYDPVTGWLRAADAATTRVINGTMAGVVAGTPTSWSPITGPVVTAGGYHGTLSICYTENATANQVTYQNAGTLAAVRTVSGYVTKTNGVAGNILLGYHNTGPVLWTWAPGAGNASWARVSDTDSSTGSAIFLPQFGTQFVLGGMVASGYYCADAFQSEDSTLYPSPYCNGAANPTTCSAELATHALSATELPPSRGRLRVSVKPFWAATEPGISRTVLHNLGADAVSGTADDLWLDYNQAASTWRWRAGGQTISSAVSAHARETTIAMEVTWQDGHKISISVDGGAPAYSAGVMASAVLHATTGRGTTAAGADQFDGYVGGLEVWTR